MSDDQPLGQHGKACVSDIKSLISEQSTVQDNLQYCSISAAKQNKISIFGRASLDRKCPKTSSLINESGAAGDIGANPHIFSWGGWGEDDKWLPCSRFGTAQNGRTTKYSYDVGGAFLYSLLRLAGLPGSQYDVKCKLFMHALDKIIRHVI